MSDHFKINDGPAACLIGIKGSAFDLPTTKRAYTYAEQPGNFVAYKLGRACSITAKQSSGDWIDTGLALLCEMQKEGFGVFDLGAEYTHPSRQWQGLTNEEVDQMASNAVDAWECARAVEEKLRAKNSTLACIPAVPPG
jgi:hypothetical protein